MNVSLSSRYMLSLLMFSSRRAGPQGERPLSAAKLLPLVRQSTDTHSHPAHRRAVSQRPPVIFFRRGGDGLNKALS